MHPSLIQLSTRDWLGRLSGDDRHPISLDAVPEQELSRIANDGFEWIYLLGIWQTGAVGCQIAREAPDLQPGYHQALSDFQPDDVVGSPFAVQSYDVHRDFGGNAALAALRRRMADFGLRLMLDFVPNHIAIDHRWPESYPDRLVQGSREEQQRSPNNYRDSAGKIFAHGRDPYFPGWTDTLQLDYSNPDTVAAMQNEMREIAKRCDGVRCDMAMLVLPDVFQQTWGRPALPFWPGCIDVARQEHAEFVFCAEVYWGREWDLQQLGFHFTYDKTLYDRLVARAAGLVRAHLSAALDYQQKSVRFLENHDEPRIAHELPGQAGRAAAQIAYSVPGLRFFHDGQTTGARRKPVVQLRRRERELTDPDTEAFYGKLLKALQAGAAQGEWTQFAARGAWEGNQSNEALIAHGWSRGGKLKELVIVNFSQHASQGYISLPDHLLEQAEQISLTDLTSDARYERDRVQLVPGLYVDLAAWQGYFFRLDPIHR